MAIKQLSLQKPRRKIRSITTSPVRLALISLLLLALLAYQPSPQLACGPFSNDAVFTFDAHPDYPLEKYAAGELGILLPTYARSYLFVAYRYFAGTGFDAQEQKALVSLWKHKLREEDASSPAASTPEESAVKSWLEARKQVPGAAPVADINAYRPVDKESYVTFLNCPADAFRSATKTLAERIQRFGANSLQVKNWLAAQDQVFANCSEGQVIPAAESPSAPALIQADRRYQIAAANFYAKNFDAAEQMFTQIAADQASPFRTNAPYLAARALIRKGTLVPEADKVNAAALTEAEARLNKLLNDNSLSATHAAARRSLSFLRFRLKPETLIRELAAAVLRKGAGNTLWQDLYDYTKLMDKLVVDDPEDYLDELGRKFERLPALGREDDLTDWLMVFQVVDRPALDYSLSKWAKTGSLPWLMAAISKIDAKNPRATELVEAAAKIKSDSPAYLTLAYHSLRLLHDGGKTEPARQALDTLLAARSSALSQSSLNLFLSLRMKMARNLDELLKFAQRRPAGFSYNDDGREIPSDIKDDEELKKFAGGRVAFDYDGQAVFSTRMPLSLLKEISAKKILPDYLRREVTQAAWVKAVLLGDELTGKELAVTLQSLAPELKELLGVYINAAAGNDRKMAGLYLLLKHPGIEPYVDAGVGRTTPLAEIDNYRDNWWCAGLVQSGAKLLQAISDEDQKTTPADQDNSLYPNFLTEAQKAAARREYNQLKALGNAPNYLGAETVRLATIKPADPRVPEMLHLAVKASRYGCTDKDTGRFSKAAYDLLHKRYPKSEWAAKTKYWYGGQ